MSLYNVRAFAQGYRMVKFDDHLNPESIYWLTQRGNRFNCECFQANKPSCRHRDMMAIFLASKAVNSGRFYDYDNARWLPAIKI